MTQTPLYQSLLYSHIQDALKVINAAFTEKPIFGLVLGTGLGRFIEKMEDKIWIKYQDIPFFPTSTVESHEGALIFGKLSGIPIVVMSGRFHYYEGYSAAEVTFPIRVLHQLGIQHLILTNAAGGINAHYKEGDLVLIRDHINMLPDHPLRGYNDNRLGPRFPDMLHAYDQAARDMFLTLAKKMGLELHSGVYLGLQGPSLETPAEYKMANILGADVVGMSTIPEVIVARHEGLKVTAFSIVSNVCFPQSAITETTVEEVIRVVGNSADKLEKLLIAGIKEL